MTPWPRRRAIYRDREPTYPEQPHDPRGRELVDMISGREVRVGLTEAVPLQLWFPDALVSIVWPARPAALRVPSFGVVRWAVLFLDVALLEAALRETYALSLPHPSRLLAFQKWFARSGPASLTSCEVALPLI